MSASYHKFKMKATTAIVDRVRIFADGCNATFQVVSLPFRKLGYRIGQEAPWVIALIACTAIGVIPLIAYPVLKPILTQDSRWKREQERVRLCLEKGIDPYPYMRHKEFMYGNVMPGMATETQAPIEASFEHQSIVDFQKRKEELRNQVGADFSATAEELVAMKKAQVAEYKSQRGKLIGESKNLVFTGRDDVDVLKS